jgi:hypothetical protein
MRMNLRLWKNYRALKKVAEREGVRILNATRGGYLDVFERADFDAIEIVP